MPTSLKTGQTILFIGDSITDCARRERDVPLGVGYVRIFSDILSIREPSKRVQIINRGIGGNTVEDLRSRWEDHALAPKPDWMVVKIGINDLCIHLKNPTATPHQSPEGYAVLYEQIIALTRKRLPNTQLLIVSPFFASADATPDSQRARVLKQIPLYIDAARAVANRHSARFLDLHASIQALLADMPADLFAEDAIHPGPAGALFIAEKVHEALS